jgi:hypothetical protein
MLLWDHFNVFSLIHMLLWEVLLNSTTSVHFSAVLWMAVKRLTSVKHCKISHFNEMLHTMLIYLITHWAILSHFLKQLLWMCCYRNWQGTTQGRSSVCSDTFLMVINKVIRGMVKVVGRLQSTVCTTGTFKLLRRWDGHPTHNNFIFRLFVF